MKTFSKEIYVNSDESEVRLRRWNETSSEE